MRAFCVILSLLLAIIEMPVYAEDNEMESVKYTSGDYVYKKTKSG